MRSADLLGATYDIHGALVGFALWLPLGMSPGNGEPAHTGRVRLAATARDVSR